MSFSEVKASITHQTFYLLIKQTRHTCGMYCGMASLLYILLKTYHCLSLFALDVVTSLHNTLIHCTEHLFLLLCLFTLEVVTF